ncbi:HlyD family secretion protein [Pelatocladus sp. BLCC-F211]|uniref:HlyD family secretion protein n=1 Tax=Pelatocladus sp. BLCC-F211 TaxID=3342752 RepID=UPI0035B76DCE
MNKTFTPKSTESFAPTPTQPPQQKHRNKSIPLVLVTLLLTVGGISYLIVRNYPQAMQENTLKVSGRIEGYETQIGVKRSGRVESIVVREGEAVKKGQRLIKLDNSNDQLLQEQLRSAVARQVSAQSDQQQTISDVEEAQGEIEQVQSQIEEAKLNQQQSQGDSIGRIAQAKSTVAVSMAQLVQARAQVKQAGAELKLAKINRDRYAKLVKDGAINQQQFDQAQTTFDIAVATQEARVAAVNAANQQLSASLGELTQVKTTSFNPSIRYAQLEGLYKKRKQSYARLKSAQAKIKSAQAKVNDALGSKQQIDIQIEDSKKDLNVVSPLDGVVTARNVEPGAIVSSQTNILTVADPNTIYLRGFIPEGDIGKVRLGQTAKIFLDSAPENPLKGKVVATDPQASFTPENIYFQKDRVKQVVGIRIRVENPASCFNPDKPYDAHGNLPCAKIGMPGDAEILLQGGGASQ